MPVKLKQKATKTAKRGRLDTAVGHLLHKVPLFKTAIRSATTDFNSTAAHIVMHVGDEGCIPTMHNGVAPQY